jgi:hypothetical protein
MLYIPLGIGVLQNTINYQLPLVRLGDSAVVQKPICKSIVSFAFVLFSSMSFAETL